MQALDRRARLKAAMLAALAGYVDAIGFIGTGGFFLSFMSGNSTRLAVGLAEGAPWLLMPLGLIAAFVGGVMVATLVGRIGDMPARSNLMLVTALLASGAALAGAGQVLPALLLVTAAMGAENLVFAKGADVRFGLTYMTGTLVRLGQRLGDAIGGQGPWRHVWPLLLHWLCLLAGAVTGALLWPALGFAALWPAVAVAAMLALLARG